MLETMRSLVFGWTGFKKDGNVICNSIVLILNLGMSIFIVHTCLEIMTEACFFLVECPFKSRHTFFCRSGWRQTVSSQASDPALSCLSPAS